MNKELYVSSTPHETKVALVEDDQLAEVFFERGNEYTLAGSIYKGRVTRVLPGMQSAFVEIGLERDAFLYVSDFLELGDEEDSEEFGEIPAPRTTVNMSQQPQPQNGGAQAAIAQPPADEESEFLAAVGDVAPIDGNDETDTEEVSAAPSGEQKSEEGARRWRGRRRRGGRRGGRDERPERVEPKLEAEKAEESPAAAIEAAPEAPAERRPETRSGSRHETRGETRPSSRGESRSRSDFGPPAGYTPMVLPGESISKYRNLAQAPAAVVAEEPETASETTEAAFVETPEGNVTPAEAQHPTFETSTLVAEQPEVHDSTAPHAEPLSWSAAESRVDDRDAFIVSSNAEALFVPDHAEIAPETKAIAEPETSAQSDETHIVATREAEIPQATSEASEHEAQVEAAEHGTIEGGFETTEEEHSYPESQSAPAVDLRAAAAQRAFGSPRRSHAGARDAGR